MQKEKKKWRGKLWYQIIAPKLFGQTVIGETLIADPNLLIGRVVEVNLMDLIANYDKYYIKIFFKIKETDANKAFTEFFGFDLTKDYIARVVQPYTARVDTNDIVQFVDSKLRIKTIAICNRLVQTSVDKAIRKAISQMLKEWAKDSKTEQFLKTFIDGELQQKIKKDISKIYPLKFFEIRKCEII